MAHSADRRPFEFGMAFKGLRMSEGLTLEEGAARAEIVPEHLRVIEEEGGGSKHRGPSIRVAERIANASGYRVTLEPIPPASVRSINA